MTLRSHSLWTCLFTYRRHFPKYKIKHKKPPAKHITHQTPSESPVLTECLRWGLQLWFSLYLVWKAPPFENSRKNAGSFLAPFLLGFSDYGQGLYKIYLSNTFIEYCDNFICIWEMFLIWNFKDIYLSNDAFLFLLWHV